MKHITLFENWNTQIQPSVASDRPLRKLSELGINRLFKDERYEYELFPRFRRLQLQHDEFEKKPNLEQWFIMMQNSDAEFYTLVQTGALGQPDVRELFRDLTRRRASKMKKYNLS